MKLAHSLHEQIASHLRRRIVSGELAGGTALREQSIAAEFGISRGPIRDAFLTLTKEGLLVAKPNVGVRVAAQPSPFQRGVVVDVRRRIEAAALSAWFATRDPALLGRLEENLGAYRRACLGGTLPDVVELDMGFHRLLVEQADGGSLVDLWLPVILRMFLRYSRHSRLIESHDEHASIVDAMRKGRESHAQARLRNHIV